MQSHWTILFDIKIVYYVIMVSIQITIISQLKNMFLSAVCCCGRPSSSPSSYPPGPWTLHLHISHHLVSTRVYFHLLHSTSSFRWGGAPGEPGGGPSGVKEEEAAQPLRSRHRESRAGKGKRNANKFCIKAIYIRKKVCYLLRTTCSIFSIGN